jgi:hypothetical protein
MSSRGAAVCGAGRAGGAGVDEPDHGVWLERLEAEHDNLQAVLEWSQGEDQGAEVGLRLAAALWRFWLVHGHLREGRRWLAAVLAGSRGALPAVQAPALSGAGALAEDQGDYAAARAFFEASLALRRESVRALPMVCASCTGEDRLAGPRAADAEDIGPAALEVLCPGGRPPPPDPAPAQPWGVAP